LKYPKIFGKAGVFSPSFWYSEKIYQMMDNPKLRNTDNFKRRGRRARKVVAINQDFV
jgi:alpha-glucosidase